MAALAPLEQARRWWKRHVDAGRYVLPSTSAPSAAIARVLRQEGLVMDVAGKRVWLLTAERPTDRRAVFLANYWPVVALVLGRYEPAAVCGVGAIRLKLEDFSPPEELPAYQGANQSEYALTLEPGFILRLRPHSLASASLAIVDAPGRARVPVLTDATVLSTLDERELNAGVEPVSAWLRHLVVRTPELAATTQENPRPLVLQRLADMATALGNDSLGRQLDAAARRVSSRVSSPSRTGVGTRIRISTALRSTPRGTGSPWLDEQSMRLTRQAEEIDRLIGTRARHLPKFSWRTLRAHAELVKAHDAYHSTTMEGYRISREISDAIVQGEPFPAGPRDRATLEAAMAIQGYAMAFGEVLDRARTGPTVDTTLILDLHEALFRPAVDAGITDTAALRGWRTTSVGLRGWRYVPPNPKKVPDLISGLERFFAQQPLSAVARALLLHLELVTIHPFLDGNGRLARLLMNHVLLGSGLPWVTVRSDERVPFFRSIERAQVDGETAPFARFLWHLIQQAGKELRRERGGRRAARSRSARET
jgi:Fic family protein